MAKTVEAAKDQIALDQLPTGTRLVVRSKLDWRCASVARRTEDKVILTVCSPSGRAYRLRRGREDTLLSSGDIPVLWIEDADDWRLNFTEYDTRW